MTRDRTGQTSGWDATIVGGEASERRMLADRLIRQGWMAALAAAFLSVASLYADVFLIDDYRPGLGSYLSTLMTLVLAVGVYSKGRGSAVLLLVLTFLDTALTIGAAGGPFAPPQTLAWGVVQLVFLYCYVQALRGIAIDQALRGRVKQQRGSNVSGALGRQLPLITFVLLAVLGAGYWFSIMKGAVRSGAGRSLALSSSRSGGGGSSKLGSGGSSSGSTGSTSTSKGSASGSSKTRSSGSGGGGSKKSGPSLISRASNAAMAKASEAGESFAVDADDNGCLAETMRRMNGCTQGECYSLNVVFGGACLAKSSRTPGFCSSVPSSRDSAASAAWRNSVCQSLGGAAQHCQELFEGVQQHCEGRRG